MQYRFAAGCDAAVLARMNEQLIQDEGHRNPMSASQLEDRMRTWIEGDYQAVLFQDADGVAGYALFKHEPEWIYLRQFFVQRHRRRRGVGRKAIEWLMREAWKSVPRVRLDVLVGSATAMGFWRSLGFIDYCVTLERPATPLEENRA